jgi:hypothetical protein
MAIFNCSGIGGFLICLVFGQLGLEDLEISIKSFTINFEEDF